MSTKVNNIMVSSRHRTSIAAAAAAAAATASSTTTSSTTTTTTTTAPETPTSRVPKTPIEEWTTREKLSLASLALKHNNSWNTVARQMQNFAEKDRPDGWSNQKMCAAQFDKLMNELGVDKRPKRNETTDASGSVIYKKMAEKRISELEESIVELRKAWLKINKDLKAMDEDQPTTKGVKSEQATSGKQKNKPQAQSGKTSAKGANTSVSSEPEKPPTRALTRRESSRQNLEKTFATLYQEAAENKSINQLCRPSSDTEKSLGSYDKVILKHVDMATLKKNFSGEIDDPYAVMNDFLLMFQNATMYYPPDHQVYKTAIDLRDKLLSQWERQVVERHKQRG